MTDLQQPLPPKNEPNSAGDSNQPAPTHQEPDETGEGVFTRETPEGGFELRLTEDHRDPPLAEQMAKEMDLRRDWAERARPHDRPA